MTEELQRLAELLQPAQVIAVIVGKNAAFDQVAAATALAVTIKQMGKEATVYAPKTLTKLLGEEATSLIFGSHEWKTNLGKQNLVISFDYIESAVDKVSYAISQDNQKFYLTIKPQAGAAPLDPTTVEFAMAGTNADLLFLIGEHDLTNLDQLYYGYEEVYANTPLVTINSFVPDIGNVHFNTADFSSYSETVTMMLGGLQLPIESSAATNLYAGMIVATHSFSALSVQADTFEIAAELLRRGARRSQQLLQFAVAANSEVVADSDAVSGEKITQINLETAQVFDEKPAAAPKRVVKRQPRLKKPTA